MDINKEILHFALGAIFGFALYRATNREEHLQQPVPKQDLHLEGPGREDIGQMPPPPPRRRQESARNDLRKQASQLAADGHDADREHASFSLYAEDAGLAHEIDQEEAKLLEEEKKKSMLSGPSSSSSKRR